MKTPKIKGCPCCGVELIVREEVCGQVVAKNVRPVCENQESACTYDEAGRLLLGRYHSHTLIWECTICGAKWVHGQFDGDEKQACDHKNHEMRINGLGDREIHCLDCGLITPEIDHFFPNEKPEEKTRHHKFELEIDCTDAAFDNVKGVIEDIIRNFGTGGTSLTWSCDE